MKFTKDYLKTNSKYILVVPHTTDDEEMENIFHINSIDIDEYIKDLSYLKIESLNPSDRYVEFSNRHHYTTKFWYSKLNDIMNYLKIYNSLIYKRQVIYPLTKTGDGLIETQHIIPTSCGGPDESWNRVNLTAREHFVAHWLLKKIYDTGKYHNAMVLAFQFMCNTKTDKASGKNRGVRCTSRVYANARYEAGLLNKDPERRCKASKTLSNRISITDGTHTRYINKTDLIPDGWRRGQPKLSAKTRQKISDSLNRRPKQKRVVSNETRQKISNSKRGKKYSAERCAQIKEIINRPDVKAKLSATITGAIKVNNGEIEKLILKGQEIPPGFVRGRLKFSNETRNKMSLSAKKRAQNKIWVNDGVRMTMVDKDHIPEGFQQGWLKSDKRRINEISD